MPAEPQIWLRQVSQRLSRRHDARCLRPPLHRSQVSCHQGGIVLDHQAHQLKAHKGLHARRSKEPEDSISREDAILKHADGHRDRGLQG